jgi:hypothetical protein
VMEEPQVIFLEAKMQQLVHGSVFKDHPSETGKLYKLMMHMFIAQIDADMPQSGYGSASEELHHHTSETGKMYKLMYTNSLHKSMQSFTT